MTKILIDASMATHFLIVALAAVVFVIAIVQ
jgi:hypothetical protein